MSTYEELHNDAHNRLNLRKAQRSLAAIGRKSEVERIDFRELSPGELPDFPSLGYKFVGRVNTDGWAFGREEETDEANSHGFADPGRIDTESVTRTISTTAQETFRRVIREIVKGADYSGVRFTEGGFLVLDEPDMPEHEEWSLILLFRDGPASNRFIFGRQFGSIQLTEAGDEQFGGEGVIEQELTWRVMRDEESGTPYQEFFGGPAFEALAESLGYEPESGDGSGEG